MKSKSSKVALAALLVACAPWVVSGCGDDGVEPSPGNGGETSGGTTNGGTTNGGGTTGNGGKKSSSGSAGSKAYAGNQAMGGEGGEGAEPTNGGAGGTSAGGVGGNGGNGGVGGKGGAGAGGGGTAGASGTAGTSGTAGMGGTAGSGGSVGSGGSNPGPTCGNGVVDAGETCDPPTGKYTVDDCGSVWGALNADPNGSANDCEAITPAACATCEAASECAELMGSAALAGKKAEEGPAKDVLRSVLYNETLDCVRDTQCANGLLIDCYCGTASGPQCDAGNGNGKCRGVIERGVETTNPTEITARLTNLTLGGGLALARVSCDQNNCLEQCITGSGQ